MADDFKKSIQLMRIPSYLFGFSRSSSKIFVCSFSLLCGDNVACSFRGEVPMRSICKIKVSSAKSANCPFLKVRCKTYLAELVELLFCGVLADSLPENFIEKEQPPRAKIPRALS